MRTTNVLAVSLAIALALAVSACTAGSSAADGAGDGLAHVQLTLQDMEFDPDRLVVAAGETITVDMRNDGQAQHDLLIETGYHSPVLDPGAGTSVEIGPFAAGTYEAICTLPGHQQAGMVLEIEAR